VARHADVWHYWWIDEWVHRNKVLERWCAIGADGLDYPMNQLKRFVEWRDSL